MERGALSSATVQSMEGTVSSLKESSSRIQVVKDLVVAVDFSVVHQISEDSRRMRCIQACSAQAEIIAISLEAHLAVIVQGSMEIFL